MMSHYWWVIEGRLVGTRTKEAPVYRACRHSEKKWKSMLLNDSLFSSSKCSKNFSLKKRWKRWLDEDESYCMTHSSWMRHATGIWDDNVGVMLLPEMVPVWWGCGIFLSLGSLCRFDKWKKERYDSSPLGFCWIMNARKKSRSLSLLINAERVQTRKKGLAISVLTYTKPWW